MISLVALRSSRTTPNSTRTSKSLSLSFRAIHPQARTARLPTPLQHPRLALQVQARRPLRCTISLCSHTCLRLLTASSRLRVNWMLTATPNIRVHRFHCTLNNRTPTINIDHFSSGMNSTRWREPSRVRFTHQHLRMTPTALDWPSPMTRSRVTSRSSYHSKARPSPFTRAQATIRAKAKPSLTRTTPSNRSIYRWPFHPASPNLLSWSRKEARNRLPSVQATKLQRRQRSGRRSKGSLSRKQARQQQNCQ